MSTGGCCSFHRAASLAAANGRKLLVLGCCSEINPRPPGHPRTEGEADPVWEGVWGVQEAGVSLCCRERWCGGRQGGSTGCTHTSGPCLTNFCVPPPVPSPGYHRPDPQPGPVPGQPCPAAGGGRHPPPGPAAGEGSPGCSASRRSRHAAALHGEPPWQGLPVPLFPAPGMAWCPHGVARPHGVVVPWFGDAG